MIERSWQDFADSDPELAEFGRQRLHGRVAYLATARNDGSPRVHPVTPAIGEGRFFIFMEPTSPKGHDLRRDGRYAMHSAMDDTSGSNGEFHLAGRARLVEDAATREQAVRVCSYSPQARYVLFEMSVESAASTVYAGDDVLRKRWRANKS